jgi:type IV pilus assembly protein PilA
MRAKGQTPVRDEAGFTLIELLVVMLIVGILASIAVPSFLSQREKASDADAKTAAKTAATAAETLATENNGVYDTPRRVNPGNLRAIEPTLRDVTLQVRAVSATGYTVRVISDSGNRFDFIRTVTGGFQTQCRTRGRGGCPADGTWD